MLTLTHSFAALGALLIAATAPAMAAPAPGDKLLAELDGRSFYRSAGAVRAEGDACVSCSSCASGSDSCAVNTPGGLLELTTFWDTDPATGPADMFTIHGLWPDNCDGSYKKSGCDSSRDYTGIGDIIKNAGQTDLYNYMNTNWIPNDSSNEEFWEHEWSKHGTCVSTLAPNCYGSSYKKYDDLVDFFSTTVALHKKYNIYQALSQAGITPGDKKYQLSDLESATQKAFGQKVLFQCESGGISGGYLSFHTKGRSNTPDNFILIAPSEDSECPSSVSYVPKNGGSGGSGGSGSYGGGSGSYGGGSGSYGGGSGSYGGGSGSYGGGSGSYGGDSGSYY